MDRFDADYKILKDAVSEIEKTKSPADLNALDTKIGTILRSLQMGVLVMAQEIKKKVDDKRKDF